MPSNLSDIEFIQALCEDGGSRLSEAFCEAGIGLLHLDLTTREISFSRSLAERLGLDTGGYSSQLDVRQMFVHPDDHWMPEPAMIAHIEHGQPYETLMRFKHANGQYLYCRTIAKAFFDADGNPDKMIGIVREVDAHERGKEAMRRAERMVKLGNWHQSLTTGETTWSEGMFIIHGVVPGTKDVTEDWVFNQFIAEDQPRVREEISTAIAKAAPFEFRARISTSNDEILSLHIVGDVEVGAKGEVVAYYGVARDITHELQRETLFIQSQKAETIGNMAGGVAHDFNNHLAVILGNLELMQEETDDPVLLAHINTCINAATNGAELTKNMLSFARKAPLVPQLLDINQVVKNTDQWARRALPATISTEVSLQAGLWKTEVDRSSAESALLNLILNARDAMPDGGKLTIETSNMRIDEDFIHNRNEDLQPGRYVMLSVSDTGHGIPETMLNSIFDPFFTTKEPGKGTGLGLSMVMGFMKQSNGTLRVYSEAGTGTTFNAYFKATYSSETEKPAKLSAPIGKQTECHRILVAEDETGVADILLRILRNAGYDVTLAENGDVAKVIFEQDPGFDLLLTDIVMPGTLQGSALAKELRAIRGDLPVVFMSGYANEAMVHGNGLRPEDIRLMKPVRRRDLLATLEKALSG